MTDSPIDSGSSVKEGGESTGSGREGSQKALEIFKRLRDYVEMIIRQSIPAPKTDKRKVDLRDAAQKNARAGNPGRKKGPEGEKSV